MLEHTLTADDLACRITHEIGIGECTRDRLW